MCVLLECKMRFISFLDFLIKSKILLQLLIYWIVKGVAYVFNDPQIVHCISNALGLIWGFLFVC